jgi:hypothetical protein
LRAPSAAAFQRGGDGVALDFLEGAREAEGIYVGEIVIHDVVKGTAYDRGQAAPAIDGRAVAQKYGQLVTDRNARRITLK